MKFNFMDFLSWLLIALLVVLVAWRVFGNSPSEWAVTSVIIGIVVVKMVNVGERMVVLEMGTKNGFCNMKKDVDLVRQKIDKMEMRLGLIGDKLGVGER